MNKIAIIGAGFSASVLCHYLKEKDIIVFDKARGPGGRSSTRKVDGIGVFDHGLQYISPKSREFLEYVQNLKLVKKWEGDFIDVETGKVLPKKDRYIGINGNNDFVKSTLDPAICKFNHKVDKIERANSGWKLTMDSGEEYKAETVILTPPQMQTYKLIKDLNVNFEIKENFMKPCFSLMLAIKNNDLFKYSGYVTKNSKIISWCANESSKERGKNNKDLTILTLQSTEKYALKNYKKYKTNKELILNEMLNEFVNIFKILKKDLIYIDIHGWLYAYGNNNKQNFFWINSLSLGIIGDWLADCTVESSWLNAINFIKKNHT